MIKWFKELSASVSESNQRSSENGRGKLTVTYASDPSEWERMFLERWRVVERLLDVKEMNVEHVVDHSEMTKLLENTNQMCSLLMLEVNSQPEPSIGPILDMFFTQQILDRVLDWSIQLPSSFKPACQLYLIQIYEGILGDSHTQNHCLLVHKPILNPLFRLCEWCHRADHTIYGESKRNEMNETEKHFVLLLNQISTKLAEDKTLLHFFFHGVTGFEQFSVFTHLISFLYEQSSAGQLARDAVLLILAVCSTNESVSSYIANKTAFCAVVATGLSGCFSQLPRYVLGEGAERIIEDASSEYLVDFHASLLFCNAVVQGAHPCVGMKIAEFFYTGFLLPVVRPALMQEDMEYTASCLAYLQLCIDILREESLVFMVIRMLLTEKDDTGLVLYERLIHFTKFRDNTAIVAVSLLDTLLQMCCEDFMLVTVFRPIMANFPTSKKQLAHVNSYQRCQAVAQQALDCIPKCMAKFPEVASLRTVEIYVKECRLKMEVRTAQANATWKYRFDGITPANFCFPTESDDDATTQVSFSRMSSCRSSFGRTKGLNGYFQSQHLSQDFNFSKINALGVRSEEYSTLEDENDLEEDDEFILPPIDESKMMTSSMMEYLHLADLSESDESSTKSRVGSNEATDSEPAFVLTGYSEIEDKETLVSLLTKSNVKSEKLSTDVLVDFFDKKHAEVMSMTEEKEEPKREETLKKEKEDHQKKGISVHQFSEKPLLLELILEGLETLCENSLPFNAEMCSLLTTLMCYPQPLLSYFFFDVKLEARVGTIIPILETMKTRIDVMSEGIEGFDVWVARGLKTLEARAAKVQRAGGNPTTTREEDVPVGSLLWGRSFGGSMRKAANFRLHSHKFIETAESLKGDTTAKQTAIAAIFHANICQMVSAVALNQSLIV